MGILNTIIGVVFLAFFAFGSFQVVNSENVNTDLKNRFVDEIKEQPLFASIFVKVLDEITPTISFPVEKKILLITEFPVFSWAHLLIIMAITFIAGFFLRAFHVGFWKKLLTFLLIIVIGYFIASLILISLYYFSANQLGFDNAEAQSFRQEFNSSFENIVTPLIVGSLFVLLGIFRIIFYEMRKK